MKQVKSTLALMALALALLTGIGSLPTPATAQSSGTGGARSCDCVVVSDGDQSFGIVVERDCVVTECYKVIDDQ